MEAGTKLPLITGPTVSILKKIEGKDSKIPSFETVFIPIAFVAFWIWYESCRPDFVLYNCFFLGGQPCDHNDSKSQS